MERTYDDSRGRALTKTVWHRQIDEKRTIEDVLETVRDYLASVTPAELGRIPETARPGRIKSDDDIEYWTFKLGQQHCDADGEVDYDLIQEMFNHLLHAQLRIAEINKGV